MWFGKGLYKEFKFLVSCKFKKLGCIFSNNHKIGKLQPIPRGYIVLESIPEC